MLGMTHVVFLFGVASESFSIIPSLPLIFAARLGGAISNNILLRPAPYHPIGCVKFLTII